MTERLFTNLQRYGLILIQAKALLGEGGDKAEYQIYSRIFNNAFCGMIKNGYPFYVSEDKTEEILYIDDVEYRCPDKSVQNIIRSASYDEIISRALPLSERGLKNDRTGLSGRQGEDPLTGSLKAQEGPENESDVPEVTEKDSVSVSEDKSPEGLAENEDERKEASGPEEKETGPSEGNTQTNVTSSSKKKKKKKKRKKKTGGNANAAKEETAQAFKSNDTFEVNITSGMSTVIRQGNVADGADAENKPEEKDETETTENEIISDIMDIDETSSEGPDNDDGISDEEEMAETVSGQRPNVFMPRNSEDSDNAADSYDDPLREETKVKNEASVSEQNTPKRTFGPKIRNDEDTDEGRSISVETRNEEKEAGPVEPEPEHAERRSLFKRRQKEDVKEKDSDNENRETPSSDTDSSAGASSGLAADVSDEDRKKLDSVMQGNGTGKGKSLFAPRKPAPKPENEPVVIGNPVKENAGAPLYTDVEPKYDYSHDSGRLFTHTHNVTLQKRFGAGTEGPYRFIFWPIFIPDVSNDKQFGHFLLHVTDPEGNENVYVTNNKETTLTVNMDGKEFQAYAIWDNMVFNTYVVLANKTDSMYKPSDEVTKNVPDNANRDSFLDQFRYAKKGQPKHFIVPFRESNNGELNIPITGYVEINGRRVPLTRMENNELQYKTDGRIKVIRGHWEKGLFSISVENANFITTG